MAYEQAYSFIGEQPTWLLRDLAERLPVGNLLRDAAIVLLRKRQSA